MAYNFQPPVEWNDLVQNRKQQNSNVWRAPINAKPNLPFNVNPLSIESNGWTPLNNPNNALLALPPSGFEFTPQLQTPNPPPQFIQLPNSIPNTPGLNPADQSTWPTDLKDFVSDLRGLTNTKFGLQIPTLVRDYNNLQRSNNNLPPSVEKNYLVPPLFGFHGDYSMPNYNPNSIVASEQALEMALQNHPVLSSIFEGYKINDKSLCRNDGLFYRVRKNQANQLNDSKLKHLTKLIQAKSNHFKADLPTHNPNIASHDMAPRTEEVLTEILKIMPLHSIDFEALNRICTKTPPLGVGLTRERDYDDYDSLREAVQFHSAFQLRSNNVLNLDSGYFPKESQDIIQETSENSNNPKVPPLENFRCKIVSFNNPLDFKIMTSDCENYLKRELEDFDNFLDLQTDGVTGCDRDNFFMDLFEILKIDRGKKNNNTDSERPSLTNTYSFLDIAKDRKKHSKRIEDLKNLIQSPQLSNSKVQNKTYHLLMPVINFKNPLLQIKFHFLKNLDHCYSQG